MVLVLLSGYLWISSPAPAGEAAVRNSSVEVQGPAPVYLPLVVVPEQFAMTPAVWAPGVSGESNRVVLFRSIFSVDHDLIETRLSIFADTRYEAWLDGQWIGRGPARFTHTQREFDTYSPGMVMPGEHTLAVLVQWAPNIRRSESAVPLLKARFLGLGDGGWCLLSQTGAGWKTLAADAWRSDAALVHAWNLVGPSELLDFHKLPDVWQSPGFDDSAWLPARSVNENAALGQEIDYSPRSIPMLQDIALPLQVVDQGRLAPGMQVVELAPGTQPVLTFRLTQETAFVLEALSGSYAPEPAAITIDNQVLIWSAAGAARPDVVTATAWLGSGQHTVRLPFTGAAGMTLGVGRANLADLELVGSSAPLFHQATHAGRRLLLAKPVQDPTAVLIEASQALTLTIAKPPAYVILDLGRTVHGRLVGKISGPVGTVVDIGWDERLLPGTLRPLPFPGTQHVEWNQVDSWVLDGSDRDLVTIDSRAGRYILIAAWIPSKADPVLAEGVNASIRLSGLKVLEERYPVEQVGSFVSNDPRLDAIWQVGVDSLVPNMTDSYTDTPWRERGQWWGDAYVADRVNQVSFGDQMLLRRGLSLMADAFQESAAPAAAPNNHAPNMLDFSMLWVLDIAEYSQRTGDLQAIYELYPTLLPFMQHLSSYRHAQTGLLDIPYGPWWTTGYIETRGAINRYGQSTAMNSLYSATLEQAAWIASQAGDISRSQAWQQQAANVRSAINAYLYLPAENRYLAHIYQGVPDAYPVSPHAQAWALAYGVVPEGDRQAVADTLLDALSTDPGQPNLDIYGMAWVLEGLGDAGRLADALSIIDSYYGRMLDLGATSWWERFDSNCCFNSTLSHAWGGAPTWFMTTYILGLQQTGPDGYSVDLTGIRLAAEQTHMQQVSGSIPVGDGAVYITWQSGSCLEGAAARLLQVDLHAAGQIYGTARLAGGGTEALLLNGAGVLLPEIGVSLPLASPDNHLELELSCGAGE